jgi:hypothetical protein
MAAGQLSFFNPDTVTYTVSSKNAEVTVSMVFGDAETKRLDAIPISGFPRALIAETTQSMELSCHRLAAFTLTDLDSHPYESAPKTPVIDLRQFWDDTGLGLDGFPNLNYRAPDLSSTGALESGPASPFYPDWEERRLRRRSIAPSFFLTARSFSQAHAWDITRDLT